MPADLFKKAPEICRRRAMTIVNLILTGHYKISLQTSRQGLF